MYCNAMAVLKIDSVYKGKNYHPQTYIENVNTPTQKNDNAAC